MTTRRPKLQNEAAVDRRIGQCLARSKATHSLATRNASSQVAHRYLTRIQQRIAQLEYVAERGTIRSTRSGLRLIGILPTVNLAFTVSEDTVHILRVLYGGQDWQPDLTTEEPGD